MCLPEASRTIRLRSAIWCGANHRTRYGVMYRLPHSCGAGKGGGWRGGSGLSAA